MITCGRTGETERTLLCRASLLSLVGGSAEQDCPVVNGVSHGGLCVTLWKLLRRGAARMGFPQCVDTLLNRHAVRMFAWSLCEFVCLFVFRNMTLCGFTKLNEDEDCLVRI